ncbi:hypothetical protein GQ457_09G019710 [Hibiscus cannabinus]
MQQVFSPYGLLEKVVPLQESDGCQFLIQYQGLRNAIEARSSLQGHNVYDGCCKLEIQFYKDAKSTGFAEPTQIPESRVTTEVGSGEAQMFDEMLYQSDEAQEDEVIASTSLDDLSNFLPEPLKDEVMVLASTGFDEPVEDIFDSRATAHNNVGSVNSNQPVQFLSLTQLGKLLVKWEQDLMLSVSGASQMFEEMLTRINGALSIVGSIHLVSDSAITHCLVRFPKKLLRVNSSLDEIISLEFTYMNELVDPNDPYRFRLLIMESRLLQGEEGSERVLYVSISEIVNNVIIPWASILNMIARLEFMKGAAMFWEMQVLSLHEYGILISSIASGFGSYTSIRKENAFCGLIVRKNFDQHRKIFDPWDILFANVTMEIDRIVRTIRSSFQLLNDGIEYLVWAEAETMFDHGFVPYIHKLQVLLKVLAPSLAKSKRIMVHIWSNHRKKNMVDCSFKLELLIFVLILEDKDLFERGSFVTMNIVTIYVSEVRLYWVAYPNGIPEEALRLVLIQPLSKNKYRKINRVLTELWWLQLVRFVGWILAQQSGCLGSTLGVRKKSSKFLLDIVWSMWFAEHLLLKRSWDMDEINQESRNVPSKSIQCFQFRSVLQFLYGEQIRDVFDPGGIKLASIDIETVMLVDLWLLTIVDTEELLLAHTSFSIKAKRAWRHVWSNHRKKRTYLILEDKD